MRRTGRWPLRGGRFGGDLCAAQSLTGDTQSGAGPVGGDPDIDRSAQSRDRRLVLQC